MKRPVRVKQWIECPACGSQVAAGYSSCTQCGHGAASWKLIGDVLALDGTRDLRYSTEDSPTTQEGQ